MHLAVGILRLQNGLDYSNVIHQMDEDGQIHEQSLLQTRTRNNSTESLPRNQSYTQMSQGKKEQKHLTNLPYFLFIYFHLLISFVLYI